ncbi:MAG TPA: hypothetical protein VJ810_38685 [Blastocatellia bacterium]|nr:hypothetical protein [Blastocatellia bacterium]
MNSEGKRDVSDHTNGLMTLRREFAKTNPTALSRAHVGIGE